MMKRTVGLLMLFWLAVTGTVAGVSLDEFSPERVARWPGGIAERVSRERWPDAQFIYPDTISDMVQLLRQGKVDAFILPKVFVDSLLQEGVHDIEPLSPPLGEIPSAFLFPKSEKGNRLAGQMNEFLWRREADGTLKALREKWFSGNNGKQHFERPALTGENGTLTAVSNGINMPFVYLKGNTVIGYEMELFALFCADCGYDYKIELAASFEGALVGVETGKYDIGINAIEITPQRREKFFFSSPTYVDECLVVVCADEGTELGFFASLERKIKATLIDEGRWKMLAMGMGTTLLITACSALFGTVLGFFLCFLHRENIPAMNNAIRLVSRFFAGMPMMVLLMLFYYVVFGHAAIGGDAVAIVVFTITTGFDVFGMLQSGAASVPKGQMEAALALGFTERQAFRKFILPQAVLTFFPTYQASLVNLLKFTAIVGYIAVQDLTKMADLIRARTYDAFMPLIAISVLYLILAWLFMQLTERLLARLDPRRRTAEEILRGVRT